eukprot:TRINITY_DN1660_c0_g1_i1.p1 TRINITY_DN1660_c0_g1~~TRINITY_DN1660_c0_g1_i1.p1  ORF type:complete len:370 (+),score=72.92 TRINITY_DN1660_c0_g1_i1:1173-2282(+)
MPSQWTISTQIAASSCQRIVYTRYVPADVLADCLAYGSATLKRLYRVPGTANLQVLSTTIESAVQLAPVAPPTSVVPPPITYPTLEFSVSRQLSPLECNSLRGAIALAMDMQISASDIVLSGSGIGGKRVTEAFAITATLTGPFALQAYQQSFGANPAARSLQVQRTIDAVPSLSGLVTLTSPALPSPGAAPVDLAVPSAPLVVIPSDSQPVSTKSSPSSVPSASSLTASTPTDGAGQNFQTAPAVIGLLAFVTVFVILVIIAIVIVAVIYFRRYGQKARTDESQMDTVEDDVAAQKTEEIPAKKKKTPKRESPSPSSSDEDRDDSSASSEAEESPASASQSYSESSESPESEEISDSSRDSEDSHEDD